MKTGFIGAGKVGFTLGKYFKESGVNVTGYYSRNLNSAKEASAFTSTEHFETLEEILTASDILFLTVSDSAIEIVWNNIKSVLRQHQMQDKIICHCSGVLSSDIFDEIEQMNSFGYSVHPLFAIHSKLNSYKEIPQALFAIEGNEKHLHTLKELIERLGNSVRIITNQQKIKYHVAATFLSNHVTALAYAGCKLLCECGFDNEFSKVALKTLFLNQCKVIAENGAVKALTGPIERNDLPTIEKHMKCLTEREMEEENENFLCVLYTLLSKQLIEMAKEKHTDCNYSDIESFIDNF